MATGDAPLYQRVEQRVGKLGHQMLERFVDEIPLYALLPREQLEGEILEITDRNLRLFFTSLRQGRLLTDEELADIRTSAARRAEERVPLDAVLTAYHVGARIGWEALVDGAEPDEHDALVASASRVLAYVQQVTGAVSAAYLEERQSIYGEERDAWRSLASLLLTGGQAVPAAARVGATIAPAYAVLTLRIDPHADEGDGGVGSAVAARRKLRRVQHALDDWAGEPVLGLLDPSGGCALLTSAVGDGQLHGLAEILSDAAGCAVVGGLSELVSPENLPAAAALSAEVLRLATALSRDVGIFRLADVLLEYQLSRPSDAQHSLAALLDPLERNPDLVHTLQSYLANDLDRRRTAGLLHVHPNTLDYRIRRIVDLTGVDPSTSRGLQLLGAALAARALRRDPG